MTEIVSRLFSKPPEEHPAVAAKARAMPASAKAPASNGSKPGNAKPTAAPEPTAQKDRWGCFPDWGFCQTDDGGKYGCFGGINFFERSEAKAKEAVINEDELVNLDEDEEEREKKKTEEAGILGGVTTALGKDKPQFAARPKAAKSRRLPIRPEDFEDSFQAIESRSYPKSQEAEIAIGETLQAHFLFSRLTAEYKKLTIDAMERVELPAREVIVKQGDPGDYFYIIETGRFSVFVDEVYKAEMSDGDCFGDLALLYNAKRAATIVSTTPSIVFRLGRNEFKNALVNSKVQDFNFVVDFLNETTLFRGVSIGMRQRVATALQPRRYGPGEVIIRQGEPGRCLYIMQRGEAFVTKLRAGVDEVRVPRKTIQAGDVFGEGSLLTAEPRVANVIVGEEAAMCLLMELQQFMDIVRPMLPDLQLNFVVSILKTVPLFQELDDEYLYQIVGAMDERHFSAGEFIFEQGSVADSFFVIMSGKLSIITEIPQDTLHYTAPEPKEIAQMLVGEFLGEMALIDSNSGKKRKTSAKCVKNTRVYVLTRSSFLELLTVVQRIKQLRDEFNARENLSKRFRARDFEVIRTLGEGENTKVKLAKHTTTGQVYALKLWKKGIVVKHRMLKRLTRERDLLYRLKHPFVVEAKGTMMDDNHLILVYELMNAGQLYGYMQANNGRLNHETTLWFSANVLVALEFLHSQNVVYRDLRPETILIDKRGFLKLSNFSAANKNSSAGAFMFPVVGIPEYIAPEMLIGTGYTRMVDVWQFGILIFEMLVGFTPFNPYEKHGRNAVEIFRNINKGEFQFPMGSNASAVVKDLVGRLLQLDPSKRLGADDDPRQGWRAISQHRLFSAIDFKSLATMQTSMPYQPILGTHDIEIQNFPLWAEDMSRELPWHGDNNLFSSW